MVDLVDKGEAELQQLTQKVTMTTSSASVKASLWVGKGVAAAPFKAVVAIYRSIHKSVIKQRESGQVSLKDFSKIAEGKRDLVNIDDRAVSKELERELRRHGVVWSVERHPDGGQTFHIQGKDAELVQHALGAAAQRVDEKLALNAPELQAETHEQQPVEELAQPVQTQQLDVPEHQTAHTPDQIAPHGSDELREDAPAHQAAERDHGGRSAEREPGPSRQESGPKLTPVDSTRAQIKGEITKRVETQKAEAATKTTTRKHTKQQRPGRSDGATAPKTTRR